jgi:endonuclease YncB( thermonuclease family)
MRTLVLRLWLITVFFAATGAARDPLAVLIPGEAGVVTSVADGDTFTMAYRGQPLKVRLVGLQAPELPHGAPTGPAGLYAGRSKQALSKIVMGQRVGLYYGGNRRDRYGRALAHVRLQPQGRAGAWVQGMMLDGGQARVYTFADNRTLTAQMLARERAARSAKRGLWALPYYAPRRAEAVGAGRDQFLIVEGRIKDVAHLKDRVYLNFGANWRTDFTVLIAAGDLRRMKALNLDRLEGRTIRVRGWVFEKNGPMIKATHPEQIEVL